MIQYRRIGEILLSRKLISQRQLDRALRLQARSHLRFGELLMQLGYVGEDDVIACLSEQFECPVVDLSQVTPDPAAIALVDKTYALGRLLLPLKIDGQVLECAISDPLDMTATDVLAASTGLRVRYLLAPASKLYDAIFAAYPADLAGESVDSGESPKLKLLSSGKKTGSKRLRQALGQPDREELLRLLAENPSQSERRTLWMKPSA